MRIRAGLKHIALGKGITILLAAVPAQQPANARKRCEPIDVPVEDHFAGAEIERVWPLTVSEADPADLSF